MRIIAFGDIHMNIGDVESIPGIHSADIIIITGDITNFGFRNEAEQVIRKLEAINSNIYGVAGNLDQPDVALYLEDMGLSLHGRGKIFNSLAIVGLGGSNYTPFNTPNEFSEQELSDFLASGISQVEEAKYHILVSHVPPFKTKTDKLLNGKHVGSTAVRTYIEEKQPLLCLCGHIHESGGQDSIGRTLVLNSGAVRDGGYLDIFFEKGGVSASLNYI
jgi:Icc-related predicted phosphoesterase